MKRYLILFFAGALVGGAVLMLPFQTVLSHFVVDDSFYYLEIARNIALGNGPTFDSLHLSNGFQPLFQLILVPIFWITGDSITGLYLMKGLEAVILGAICAALYRLATQISGGREIAGWLAVGALFIPGLDWHPLGVELMIGMESGVNALLVILTFVGLVDFHKRHLEWNTGRYLGFGLILGLLFLARVDNALIIAGILPVMGWLVLKKGGRREGSLYALMLAVASILVGGYLAWNLIGFGRLLPISGTIKAFHSARASRELWRLGFGEWMRAGFWFLTEPSALSLLPLTGLFGLPMYVVVEKFRQKQGWKIPVKTVMLIITITAPVRVLLYAFLLQMEGFHRLSWYYVPEIVSLCLLAGLGGEVVLKWINKRSGIPQAMVGVGLLVIASLVGILRTEARYDWEAASYRAVQVIGDTVPPSAVIGSKDAGVLGYFLPNPVVNLDGLVNDEVFFGVVREGGYLEYIHQEEIGYLANLLLPYSDKRDFLLEWMGEDQLELLWQDDRPAEKTEGRVYKLYRVKGE